MKDFSKISLDLICIGKLVFYPKQEIFGVIEDIQLLDSGEYAITVCWAKGKYKTTLFLFDPENSEKEIDLLVKI